MKEPYRELNFSVHRVKIKIEGFRIDKLFNKALEKGLDLRNIRVISEMEAECWLTAYDLEILRKQAKALYRITVMSEKGAYYRLGRLKRTPMKIACAVLILLLVISQSFFVKTIVVDGYKGIPETELLNCLAEAGIEEGSYIPGIDWSRAEDLIYDAFPQVTWVQLVYDGRKVFLNISEGKINTEDEEMSLVKSKEGMEEREYYCNIVADTSGYIESIGSYRGLALVEEGDYVEKGQVLISGCVPIEATVFKEDWPKQYFVRAQGEITMTVPYRLTFNQERYISGGEKDRDENIVSNKTEKSEKQIRDKVNQQIRQWAKENLPENSQILKKDLKFSYKENIIEVGVTLEVRRQIGEEQEILIGQENSDAAGN